MGEAGTEGKDSNGESAQPELMTDLEEKITQQIEYYFGDINLPRDKFLQDETKKEEGWVSLTTMIKFNRLKSLSTDFPAIMTALKKSTSRLLELNETENKIRRSPEFPLPVNSHEYWASVRKRTVYVKGFPRDVKLEDLQKFMQPYGTLENILMRRVRTDDRIFKGSIFATYKAREDCEKFLKESPEKYPGSETPFVKEFQEDYQNRKGEERKQRRVDERLAKHKQRMETEGSQFTKGIILKLSKLPKSGLLPSDVKKFFSDFGEVRWVEYMMGQDTATVRFEGEEGSGGAAWEKAVEKAEGGVVKIKDHEVEATVMEGEEEAKFWLNLDQQMRNKKENRGKRRREEMGKREGGGRGRGGRGGARGGGRGAKRTRINVEGEANKKITFSDSDDDDFSESHKEKKPEGGEVPKVKAEANGSSDAPSVSKEEATTEVKTEAKAEVKAEVKAE